MKLANTESSDSTMVLTIFYHFWYKHVALTPAMYIASSRTRTDQHCREVITVNREYYVTSVREVSEDLAHTNLIHCSS